MPSSRSLHRSVPREPLSPAERLLAAQAAILLVFSAWAGGGRLTWSPGAILAGAALGLPTLWLQVRERGRIRLRSFLPLVLWLALLGIALLNPSHVRGENGEWIPRSAWIPWLPATTDRRLSLAAAMPWLAALLEGGLIAAIRPRGRVIRFLWTIAALNGFALAAVGAAFRFSQANKMLGFIAVPEPTYFFATFFYKNHWAAYGALCATAGIVLALHAWERARPDDPHARGRVLLFSATSLLTLVTLPLPGSRTGALLGMLLVIVWMAGLVGGLRNLRGHGRRQRLIGGALLVASGLAIVGYGANAYRPRARVDMERTVQQLHDIARNESPDLRWLLSIDTWRMAKARPWFGWGIGSFPVVYPAFQGHYLRGPDGRPDARVEFAHDDWVQMVAETGFVGLAILLVPVLWLARQAWRNGSGGRRMLAGCALIAAVAWFDFPLNNPAVLLLWTVLLVTAAHAAPARRPQSFGRAA